MKTWFTAKALAGLPGLPGSERNVRAKAGREGWRSRKADVGKGMEYHVDAIPRAARAALYAGPAGLPEVYKTKQPAVASAPKGTTVGDLKDWQRETMHARLTVLAELDKRAIMIGVRDAAREIAELSVIGMLPPAVQDVMSRALAKKPGDRPTGNVSVRTLQRWRSALKKGPARLAPAAMETIGIPVWVGEFMRRYGNPTQPTIAAVIRSMKADRCLDVPTYDQARRFLKHHVGEIEKAKKRKSANEVRAMMPYVERDFSMLNPGDVINGDGHTSYTYCAHPNTGKAFLPEITEMVDIATRYYVSFSIAESEATETVHDALRSAIAICGVPLFVQWDRGSGAKNHAMHDAVTGLAARLGFEVYHPRARNPQASGVIERLHQSVAIPAAEQFSDAFVGRRAKNEDLARLVDKGVREGRVQLPSIPDLVAAIEARREWYNNEPHTSLPKIKDDVTGKMRHQSPNEAWRAAVDRGWKPVRLTDHALLDEFRPEKVCLTRRGLVKLYGMSYFSSELAEFNGKKVRVRYDWRDGAQVWVRAMDGRFICQAQRDGNVRSYMPDNALDIAREKRDRAKIRRKEGDIERIKARSRRTLEATPVPVTPLEMEQSDRQLKKMAEADKDAVVVDIKPVAEGEGRPLFTGENYLRDWGLWMLTDPPEATEADREDFARRIKKVDFQLLLGVSEAAG